MAAIYFRNLGQVGLDDFDRLRRVSFAPHRPHPPPTFFSALALTFALLPVRARIRTRVLTPPPVHNPCAVQVYTHFEEYRSRTVAERRDRIAASAVEGELSASVPEVQQTEEAQEQQPANGQAEKKRKREYLLKRLLPGGLHAQICIRYRMLPGPRSHLMLDSLKRRAESDQARLALTAPWSTFTSPPSLAT